MDTEYLEDDGPDWWQSQETVERMQYEAWEAEQAARMIQAKLSRLCADMTAETADILSALTEIRVALDQLQAKTPKGGRDDR